MENLEQLTQSISIGTDLTAEQASVAAKLLANTDLSLDCKKAFLLALADKGETGAEVAGFAATFRELAVDPGVAEWSGRAIDIVGTGGDGAGTFNISTAVSFLVAASGVPVLKHGNRSITSKCGSADMVEAVGIHLDAPHEVLRDSIRDLNYCFFFAPAFHPAFKAIMPVRKALAAEGRRTVFNLLGPLINPGRPAYQLTGVYSADWLAPLADALGSLSLKGGLVVHGTPKFEQPLDELSCAGTNAVAGFGHMSGVGDSMTAADADLPQCEFDAFAGSDAAANLTTMYALMSGDPTSIPAGLRNTVLLNAGAALWIVGRANNLKDGVAMARQTLECGAAQQWLEKVRRFYRSL